MRKEPGRLELTGSPLMRALVRVGRNETPPAPLLDRTFTALGVAAPAAAVVAAAASARAAAGALGTTGAPTVAAATSGAALTGGGALAGTPAVPVGLALLAKWVAVGVVTAAAVSGGVAGTRLLGRAPSMAHGANAPAQTAPVSTSHPGTCPLASAPASTVAAHPPRAPEAVAAFSTPSPRSGSSELDKEVKAIGAAHSALQAGDARRTLALLDQHEQSPQAGPLRAEAMYLRMEALVDLADYAAAQNAARRLLSAYPDGPHAARARAIVGMNIP